MNEIVIQFIGRRPQPQAVKIGNERENLAQRVMFCLPPDIKGSAVLHLNRGVFADVVNLDETMVFEPTLTQTQYPGKWTAYLEVIGENDMVWKSDVFYLTIADLPDDGKMIEKAYPNAFEEAIAAAARLAGLEAEVETLPSDSPATVETRKREDGKEVLVFGIPTGVGAEGPAGNDGQDGFSPTIEINAITGGYKMTVVDVNGSQTIEILNGKDGGGGEGGGADGKDGKDGVSPTVTVSAITGGHRITITDVNGAKTVDVMDGKDGAAGATGATGATGAAGYSPVRGTDYWTATDIAEIKSYVDEAILGGEW